MTKLGVILFIIKQRVPNILLVSIMFSSLIVIFMVGIGIKNIFYDYVRSDYGNIPDLKIKINNLSDKNTDSLISDIREKFSDKPIDILTGYEAIQQVSIIDSEDLLLTSGLSLFVKGLRFSNKIKLSIDNKIVSLSIADISYQDDLYIKFNLNNLVIKDINSIKIIVKDELIEYGFCKSINIEDNILTIQANQCKNIIDTLLEKLEKDKAEKLKVEIDGVVFNANINYVDSYYKSIVIKNNNIRNIKKISLAYQDIEIDNSMIESTELADDELIINFTQDNSMIKNYKIFLSKILKEFINYHRMILKLKLHSFENDDIDDKQDKQMVYLNELTDLTDLIFTKDIGNLAISSTFLAQDLNNFGILDDFTIKTDEYEYTVNIRSTIEYNPEVGYDKNILIVNQNILEENLNLKDKNNYIDIYSEIFQNKSDIETLGRIVSKYDKSFKILSQEDIIPSIKPKKLLFSTSIISISIFILSILFIAMYIVLLQFYSNFNSELSLLKLYGSKIPYQAFINFTSFLISAVLNYIFMLQQEAIINKIMLKYFFINYEISIVDYFISISILFVYVIIVYLLEYKQIKKLNLIKGQ